MKRFVKSIVLILLLSFIVDGYGEIVAETPDKGRAKIGIRLFRSMLAADLDIGHKADQSGFLVLVLVYTDNKEDAEGLKESLLKSGRAGDDGSIRGMPVKVEVVSSLAFTKPADKQLAGIFLSERVNAEELKQVVDYGIARHVIVYSPFDGDVEQGATGGLSVEARVRPYVNVNTLNESGIRIKPFFMKVAKRYE